MRDIVRGAGFFLHGFSLIVRPVIRRWAFVPIALSVVVFAGLIWLGLEYLTPLVESAVARLPDWLDWLEWLMWVVFWAGAVFAVAFGFVIVASVIASPFNGLLAEATERHLTGQAPPSMSFGRLLVRLPGIAWQELKKVVYALALALPFLLLFLVPVINVAAPAAWFVYNAWVTAFAFTDYPMDNNGLKLADMRRVLASRRCLVLGFGGLAFLALTVPLLNIVALPAAVAGATSLWVNELSRSRRV